MLLSQIIHHASMMDIGGLIQNIPDFNLTDECLLKPPRKQEMLTFIELGKSGEKPTESQKDIVDRVGSYVAIFYARAIQIFQELRKE
ncbi:TPA: hypothetical protein EYP38_00380 [Candidatus Micrarchaeota archaeon]|nr:hypothetical protein [Candidatus Micrarchaeota archaeon]